MATLASKTRGEGPAASSLATRDPWDPFMMLRDIWSWDPYDETLAPYAFSPAFEVKETKDAFVFKADLPGLVEKDVEVTITGNVLRVSGKREAEEKKEGESYYRLERTFGSFERSFALPEAADPDKIEAQLGDGVLTLTVGKRVEAQAKKVTVKGVIEAVTDKVKSALGMSEPAEKPPVEPAVEPPKT
ncbi:MAG: Hsp20/alpha crystallin family protein [Polyangiaceae bacterium]|nr:Hsp20/alpha crystallin family protein [Polyangiaceae bacterium]